MTPIPVALNRLAVFLVPKATAEAQAFLTGSMKLIVRFAGYSGVPARQAALVLSRAEQTALFGFGTRGLVWVGSRLFLVGAVIDFGRRLISGGEDTPSLETRLKIIEAHVVKGGPLWTRAIGVGEQVVFILLDAFGATIGDLAAGALSTFDMPGQTTALPPFLQGNSYYAELAAPVVDVDAVDSIIEAPGLILQPQLVPFADVNAETFPLGPMPSWGTRH